MENWHPEVLTTAAEEFQSIATKIEQEKKDMPRWIDIPEKYRKYAKVFQECALA